MYYFAIWNNLEQNFFYIQVAIWTASLNASRQTNSFVPEIETS